MKNKDKQFSAQLKSEIIKLMDGMIAFQKSYPKFNFPRTSENFNLTRELLEKGEFNLAVCGKVKNGKKLKNPPTFVRYIFLCNFVIVMRQ